MEGITPTPKPALNPLRCPFLLDNTIGAGEDPSTFDKLNFDEEFAAVLGLSIITVEQDCALARAIQQWLFFSVLSTFLGIRVVYRDFSDNQGNISMDQPVVHEYFEKWATLQEWSSWAERTATYDRILALLTTANIYSQKLENLPRLPSQSSEHQVSRLVLLSVRLLLQSLGLVLLQPQEYRDIAKVSWISGVRLPGLSGFLGFFGLQLHTLVQILLFPYYLIKRIGLCVNAPRKKRRHWKSKIDLPEERAKLLHQAITLDSGDDVGGSSTNLLLGRLIDIGWCPMEARRIAQSVSVAKSNYLALLTQVQMHEDTHDACTEASKCVTHTIYSHDVYQYKHTKNCQCDHIPGIPYETLRRVLSQCSYPIISVDTTAIPWRIEAVPYQKGIVYTFFSHVWSDGLGNPTGNSIPQCQLHRLVRLAQQATRRHIVVSDTSTLPISERHIVAKTYFWLDTLCIPRGTQLQEDNDTSYCITRGQAIKLMTPTIARSRVVLILDEVFDRLGSAAMSANMAAYIMSTKWSQRTWTLEEGCLAPTRSFVVNDAIIDATSLQKRGNRGPLERAFSDIENFQKALQSVINTARRDDFLTTDFVIKSRPEYQNQQFIIVWNSLVTRSGSRTEDALTVLANLLGFRLTSLWAGPSDARLPSLVRSCSTIPFSLLHAGASRLGPEHSLADAWLPVAIAGFRLTEGLYLEATQLVIGGSTSPYLALRWTSGLSRMSLRIYTTSIIPPVREQSKAFFIHNLGGGDDYAVQFQPSRSESAFQEANGDSNAQYCYVMDFSNGSQNPRGTAARGILCTVVTRRGGEIVIRYICPLIVWTGEQFRTRQSASALYTDENLASFDARLEKQDVRIFFEHDHTFWPGAVERRNFMLDAGRYLRWKYRITWTLNSIPLLVETLGVLLGTLLVIAIMPLIIVGIVRSHYAFFGILATALVFITARLLWFFFSFAKVADWWYELYIDSIVEQEVADNTIRPR